ncbi:hypothetical protein BC567DRAFT_277713 [Phyllosticta citribraziliensis]
MRHLVRRGSNTPGPSPSRIGSFHPGRKRRHYSSSPIPEEFANNDDESDVTPTPIRRKIADEKDDPIPIDHAGDVHFSNATQRSAEEEKPPSTASSSPQSHHGHDNDDDDDDDKENNAVLSSPRLEAMAADMRDHAAIMEAWLEIVKLSGDADLQDRLWLAHSMVKDLASDMQKWVEDRRPHSTTPE